MIVKFICKDKDDRYLVISKDREPRVVGVSFLEKEGVKPDHTIEVRGKASFRITRMYSVDVCPQGPNDCGCITCYAYYEDCFPSDGNKFENVRYVGKGDLSFI